jgi:hypothetical protein
LFREDGFSTGGANPYDAETGCRGTSPNIECLPAAASSNLLKDGRILYWNAIENTENLQGPLAAAGGDVVSNDQSRILGLNISNPVGSHWKTPAHADGFFPGSPTEAPLVPGTSNANPAGGPANDGSLFCSDQKQLFNGRILAAGGTNYYSEPRVHDYIGLIELEGIKNSRFFDPANDAWSAGPNMHYGRWYPSMVTLPDSKLLVASGVTKLMKPVYGPGNTNGVQGSGSNVKQLEVFDPFANNGNGAWSDVVGTPGAIGDSSQRSLPLFPRLHLLPTGRVYYDAAGQAFNPMGQSYDEALWNIAAVFDPAGKTWRDLGVPTPSVADTVASKRITEPGFRGSTFDQMLPLQPNANGDYTTARFLSAGGVLGTSPGSYQPTMTSRVTTVTADPTTGVETLSTVASGALNAPRWYGSGVTLPNGSPQRIGVRGLGRGQGRGRHARFGEPPSHRRALEPGDGPLHRRGLAIP